MNWTLEIDSVSMYGDQWLVEKIMTKIREMHVQSPEMGLRTAK